MSSDIVLSYQDSVLRKTDISILKGNGWLTDSIIGFYFQYLETEVYPNKSLLFISPEVTQCIKSSQSSEVKIFLEPLSAKQYSLIFFPLNNNENINTAGGWHWSLIVFDRNRNIFYHADSSNNTNLYQANTLSSKLQYYFDKDIPLNLKDLPTLQQNNGYDCGIHLLCNVENIAHYWIKYETLENISSISKDNVKGKRASILSLICTITKRCIVKK